MLISTVNSAKTIQPHVINRVFYGTPNFVPEIGSQSDIRPQSS